MHSGRTYGCEVDAAGLGSSAISYVERITCEIPVDVIAYGNVIADFGGRKWLLEPCADHEVLVHPGTGGVNVGVVVGPTIDLPQRHSCRKTL